MESNDQKSIQELLYHPLQSEPVLSREIILYKINKIKYYIKKYCILYI